MVHTFLSLVLQCLDPLIQKLSTVDMTLLYELFNHPCIWPIGGILTGTTSSGQSRPGSNVNEDLPRSLKLDPQNQI